MIYLPHDELKLDARFASLRACHTEVLPTAIPEPAMVHFNAALAQELGLDAQDEGLVEILSGNRPWPGYAPLASVYAGHQFGSWVSQLGDGRALLIAEIARPDGKRAELQLKGSGQTPYSRGADGRAVLRSSIREYLCPEAMHALGVPTTRCLSLIASPLPVMRESVETAAVVCRVSPSFVRFGHFEFFSHGGKEEVLASLADHVISENFPHIEGPHRYAEWLSEVVLCTAALMAKWQSLGFCHGVMNTDNFSILGLTIDYGPFGFMDAFRQHHVCNHSDYEGRYAYSAQPQIGQWNVSCLLQAALPLLSGNEEEAVELASEIYRSYVPAFSTEALARWTAKLGLQEVRDGDAALVSRFLGLLQAERLDFTGSFRSLSEWVRTGGESSEEAFSGIGGFDSWLSDYRARLALEPLNNAERAALMDRVNPKYVLRNHLAQAAIEKAEAGDYSEVGRLMDLLARPYDEQPGMERYAESPPQGLCHIEVSCSS